MNPYALVSHVRRWLMLPMTWWVKPAILPDNPATLLRPETPVLYVLETGGLADRAALYIATRQFSMPAPGDALRYGRQQESSSVVVLKRRAGGRVFRQHRYRHAPRLTRLVDAATDEQAGELHVVPVAIYWGRAPKREDSLWRLLFSEHWQIGGRTRKFFATLLHGRHTLVAFSEPLSMRTLVSTGTAPEQLEHKLSRVLRVHFRQRREATLGPDQSHRRTLITQVLADPGVRRTIIAEAGTDVRKHARLEAEARKYGQEIAADVSYPTIRIFNKILPRLWNGLYDGVTFTGVSRLQKVADGNEVIYVPCHRSHIDYLLMSYILFVQGFSLPHVAAGVNLNLPFVGGLLRRGGAFFLRRTFAGNKLYASVFNSYLKTIQARGHAIEYFVEGGRSRTGRLLPPKAGMLVMSAHAYLSTQRRPVVFVPVYFGYERLVEGQAFTSELAGGKKQKETVFALLRSLKKLRENYGRVHVNVGEPIALSDVLDEHKPDWQTEPIGARRPDWLRPVIDDLGTRIMRNINQAASITPVSLLASVLLASQRGALGLDETERQLALYHRLLVICHAGTPTVIEPMTPGRVIDQGVALGFVERCDDALGTLVRIRPQQAAPLTYFRNNILHLFIMPALITSCFTNNRRQSIGRVRQLVRQLWPFLQADFFLSGRATDDEIDTAIEALAEAELMSINGSELRRAPIGSDEAVALMRLSELIKPVLERYYLTSALLFRAPAEGVEQSELARQCGACADRLAMLHGRLAGDLYDKHLLRTFVDTLEQQQLIAVNDNRLIAQPALFELEPDAHVMLGERVRHGILNAGLVFAVNTTKAQEVDQQISA